MNMETFSLIFYALTALTFVYLLNQRDYLYKKIKKNISLIQNLESSRETHLALIKKLNNRLWEFENPPKYKVGQNIKHPNPRFKSYKYKVIEVNSEHDSNSFPIPSGYRFVESRWRYTVIDLKSGQKSYL